MKTSVVAVSSVQFATGTAVDVDRISKAVSEVDGHLVVDVTQELGARRIDVGAWNADAVVCSGYKWLEAMVASRWRRCLPGCSTRCRP